MSTPVLTYLWCQELKFFFKRAAQGSVKFHINIARKKNKITALEGYNQGKEK